MEKMEMLGHTENMKTALLLIALAATRANAQRGMSPEQFPGQIAQMRLALMYPRPVVEPEHALASDPARRLEDFLEDADPTLKNASDLVVYLREGLFDPRAVGESNALWETAWKRLDLEIERLQGLAARGQEIARGPIPATTRRPRSRAAYPTLEGLPTTDSPRGARLRLALELCARMEKLREDLTVRSDG